MNEAPMLVYFIAATDVGLVKIGRTRGPEQRIETMAAWSPVPLVMLACVPGSIEDEKRLHYRFRELWAHHEWFRRSDGLLLFIDQIKELGALPQDKTPYAIIRKWCLPHCRRDMRGHSQKLREMWADPVAREDRREAIRRGHRARAKRRTAA